MAIFKQKNTEKNWELVMDSLKKLRGKGLWRGKEIQQRTKNLLRLPFESLSNSPEQAECHMFISENLKDIYAITYPGEKHHHITEYDHNVDKFLEQIISEIRQRTYIRTNKTTADYRKPS